MDARDSLLTDVASLRVRDAVQLVEVRFLRSVVSSMSAPHSGAPHLHAKHVPIVGVAATCTGTFQLAENSFARARLCDDGVGGERIGTHRRQTHDGAFFARDGAREMVIRRERGDDFAHERAGLRR